MDPWILQRDWRARLTLISLVACLYAGMVVISNSLLFSWAVDDGSYRSWFYPPAGIRLALVMLLGWPGLLGYFIAAVALHNSSLVPGVVELDHAVLIAAGRALSIWGALVVYGWFTGVKTPWERLTWVHLPALALFVSLVSACVAHLVKFALDLEPLELMARNVSLTVLGDTLGSIAVLAVVVRLRAAYREFQFAREG